MNPTIEITGVRIRRAIVPVRRVLNTRVGRFTKGPFLLIDLELKGGGMGRVLGFTFMPIGLKVVPILLEALVEAVKGRKITYADAPAGARLLPEGGHAYGPRGRGADGAVDARHGAARCAGARGGRAAL